MMKSAFETIAHVIQLAIAPVFLLTSIGAMLNVMMQRLARIMDHARRIEDKLPLDDPARDNEAHAELRTLAHRLRLINRAAAACVMSAVLISAVVISTFVSQYYDWSPDMSRIVGLLFAASLLSLMTGLLFFLREIYIATATLRIKHK